MTLSEAYAAFADTPERADFLGDVAQTGRRRGHHAGASASRPRSRRCSAKAAHEGHLVLSFTRRGGAAAGRGDPAPTARLPLGGDTLHVTDANFGGNKLDYYLRARPRLPARGPARRGRARRRRRGHARACASSNTAPPDGLPQIVAGPYEGAPPGRFQEGENVSYVSVYTPARAASPPRSTAPRCRCRTARSSACGCTPRSCACSPSRLAPSQLDLAGRDPHGTRRVVRARAGEPADGERGAGPGLDQRARGLPHRRRRGGSSSRSDGRPPASSPSTVPRRSGCRIERDGDVAVGPARRSALTGATQVHWTRGALPLSAAAPVVPSR